LFGWSVLVSIVQRVLGEKTAIHVVQQYTIPFELLPCQLTHDMNARMNAHPCQLTHSTPPI
jgi:hypothetical protein